MSDNVPLVLGKHDFPQQFQYQTGNLNGEIKEDKGNNFS